MSALTRAVERRSGESSTTNPPVWIFDALGGAATKAGTRIGAQTALTISAVFAAVRVLTDAVAALPLLVYERLARGKQRRPDHALYMVLHDRPNPEVSSFQFREALQGHLLLWGNAYAELELNGRGDVVALWPLLPDRTRARWVGGERIYLTRVKDANGVEREVALPAGRVLHIAGFGFDGREGYSVVRLARESLGLTAAAEEFGSRWFGTGARPAGALMHPGALDDKARRNLRESYELMYGGLERAHRLLILEEGMKWQQIGIPPEDSQFLGTREFQVLEIARWFKVPPHMIAHAQPAPRANVEQAAIEFVVHSVVPWLTRWEQALNWTLFRPDERQRFFAAFLVAGLLRGDLESRYRAYATARQWGWFSANDIRELEDMNPVGGGDQYLVPLNMIPAGTSAVAERQIQRAVTVLPEVRTAALRRRLRATYRPLIEDAAGKVVRREARDVRRAIRTVLEDRGADGNARAANLRVAEFVAWLEQYYRDYRSHVANTFRPSIVAYGEAVAREAAREIGEDDPGDVQPFLVGYLRGLGARHSILSAQQLEQLVRETERGALVDALHARLEEWETARPAQVADRETVQAGEAVARTVWVAAGVGGLKWRANPTACPLCQQLDGRIVGSQSPFAVPGDVIDPQDGQTAPLAVDADIGHPALHTGCECWLEPVVILGG